MTFDNLFQRDKVYVIDTSALIDLYVYYHPRVFSNLASEIENLVGCSSLVTSELVLEEIQKKEDEISDWLSSRQKMVVSVDSYQDPWIRLVMKDHGDLVKPTDGIFCADPFVIALAKAITLKREKQNKAHCACVVTSESRRIANRIPQVCKALDIECKTLLQMFESENWSF